MTKDERGSSKVTVNPASLLVVILASIFSAEAFVMLLLSVVSPLSISTKWYLPLMDAGMLSLILFPVIYYLVFKPCSSQVEELRRSKDALHESEERCRSVVESTDDSIYMVDRSYRYLFMNKKHMARTGFSEGEYTGRCFSDFHSDAETRDFVEKVDIVFENDKSVRHGHQSERDQTYYLRTFSPVHGPDGKVVAVSVISKRVSPK